MNPSENSLMSKLHYKYDITPDVLQLIERSSIDIELLRGKKIFITGGTGFFGVWFLSALTQIKKKLDGNLQIISLSRFPEKFLNTYSEINFRDSVEFIKGDVRSFTYSSGDITHLVHMATTNANETFYGEDQLNKLEMLYFGTKNTILQCKGVLENVLFTSSGVAYGLNNKDFISEDDFTAPSSIENASALGIGKINAEYLVSYFANIEKYNFSIARCFSLAGQYLPLNLHYAFGNFIENAMTGNQIFINGSGLDKRSYLYIGDAIAWLLNMLIDGKNEIYNVGSENSISIIELAQKIASKSNKNIDIKVLGNNNVEIGNFKRSSYIPNTQKIRKEYKCLTEWTSIDSIVEKMLYENIHNY
jgi:UDP-glucuronate decarboxylase